MNEEEFMNKIKNSTQNLEIPESLSPENMKKLLEAHSENQIENNNKSNKVTPINKSRKHVQYAAIACAFALIIGGTSLSALTRNKSNNNEALLDIAKDDVAGEAEEAVADDTSVALDGTTNMLTPESYDAYYDTMKEYYDQYYDQFAIVESDDLLRNDVTNDVVAVEESADFASNQLGSSKDFSATNVQEENIDEGDIVKTDGNYIYKVNESIQDGEYSNSLSIIKAENGKMTFVSSIDMRKDIAKEDGAYTQFHEFYINGNNLIFLLTSEYDKAETIISIYDISDKENPVHTKTLTQSGLYNGSRIADGHLYTISNFFNSDLSVKKPYSNYIPCINGELIDYNQIYYNNNSVLDSTYVITGVDLATLETTDSKAVPTHGGEIYVGEDSIYIFGRIYSEKTQTEILRIGYNQGMLQVGNSTTLSGFVYGTFALSEWEDHLRVVATIPANNISPLRIDVSTNEDSFLQPGELDSMPKDDSAENAETSDNQTDEVEELKEDINVLYIFDQNMELVSKISGIAPGEQIKSARFLGATGYVVTYENTDPLFTIDLSNPANPTIVSKLTIPGFSEYLHPFKDHLLLGLGEERDPASQEFKGLKLTMFDTSNPEEVTVADQLVIKDGFYSTAEHNHKAILVDAQKNVIGFFYQSQIEKGDYTYETEDYYVTYEYTKDGFKETGRYKVDMSSYEVDHIRGLYIGDYLYVTSTNQICSYELNDNHFVDKIKDLR